VIVRPGAVKLRLLNHLLHVAYQQRNRSLVQKTWPALSGGVGRLLLEDVRNLIRLRPTALSVSVPWLVFRAYRRYRRQQLSVPAFADTMSRLFVTRAFRRSMGGPSAVVSVTRLRSFAKDIDTHAELAEVMGVSG
jgi:hypothetical protein